MNILNQSIFFRIFTYGILSFCILGGALTYATSVMASQQFTPSKMAIQISAPTPSELYETEATQVAYSSPTEYMDSFSSSKAEATQSKQQHSDIWLPVLTWLLGSAALAMFGYKRMRHS